MSVGVNGSPGVLLLSLVVVFGCRAVGVTDYQARPVLPDQDWGDRLSASIDGVRVVAGPVSVFPYEIEGPDGEPVRGHYQLFTRLGVESTGALPVEVDWGAAYLETPDGGRIRLLPTDSVRRVLAASRGGEGRAGTGSAAVDAARDPGNVPPSPLVERLEPGHRTSRALIPEAVTTIGVGEPLIPLCDGCEYRLVLPVRVGDLERRLELLYRLEVDRPLGDGSPFWRIWEE